jgi:hypothetical protein
MLFKIFLHLTVQTCVIATSKATEIAVFAGRIMCLLHAWSLEEEKQNFIIVACSVALSDNEFIESELFS